ncbi:MAG: RNA-binding cell elongation regulator Jag/EloR [Pseudomonadota bacterium]
MKSNLEFEGKNVKIAINAASEELNIPPSEIKYDIISNGSSGIFGLVGAKKAKIRVHLSDSNNNNARNHISQADRVRSFEENNVKTLVDEAFRQAPDRPIIVPPKHDELLETVLDAPVDIASESIQAGKKALQKIIDFISEETTVSVEAGPGLVLFNVIGGNSGVLIGKKGQNLEAIQYLIDKIVNKNSDKRVRIQVDVEGYLKTRRENLVKLAGRLAEKTKRTGRPSTIGQISAQDRRTVHLTLKADKEVRTQSIGDGYYRKLVIFPKKNNYRKKKHKDNVIAVK